ncbi:MAG TPA: alpha/beta hydrolase [Verrucomicrobiales bacterium]|nr:alpha/beta hydrolase [Verrucomicrobiales bacterium]
MNKLRTLYLCLITMAISPVSILGQEDSYGLKENISYYSDSHSDPYLQERCKLDLYYPKDKKDFATVVWFHGGGLKNGNKSIAGRLKNQGIAVAAVNYRLYPKAKAPAYLEDTAASIAWVFKNIEQYGGSTEKIFVSGSSAGGYLTGMVGLDKRWLGAHGINADQIAGLIPLAGQMFTHFTIREERGIGKTQVMVDDLAPISHIRNDAPPILFVTGDRTMEMIARWEENAYMYRMMLEVGHPDARLLELQGYGHAPQEAFYPLLLKEMNRVLKLRGNK